MTLPDRITSVLVQIMGVPAETIRPDACLYSDLGFDSIDHVECIIAVEEAFDIEFSDAEAEGIKTVADASRAVEARRPTTFRTEHRTLQGADQ